ncbi:hypothetical protein HK101_005955, partial [Irineochytrium annulatum]
PSHLLAFSLAPTLLIASFACRLDPNFDPSEPTTLTYIAALDDICNALGPRVLGQLDCHGVSVLHYASTLEDSEVVETMMWVKARYPVVVDNDGDGQVDGGVARAPHVLTRLRTHGYPNMTPLAAAVRGGSPNAVEVLLGQFGADPFDAGDPCLAASLFAAEMAGLARKYREGDDAASVCSEISLPSPGSIPSPRFPVEGATMGTGGDEVGWSSAIGSERLPVAGEGAMNAVAVAINDGDVGMLTTLLRFAQMRNKSLRKAALARLKERVKQEEDCGIAQADEAAATEDVDDLLEPRDRSHHWWWWSAHDEHGITPLHRAVGSRHGDEIVIPMIDALLDTSSKRTPIHPLIARDRDGLTPLSLSITRRRSLTLITRLLTHPRVTRARIPVGQSAAIRSMIGSGGPSADGASTGVAEMGESSGEAEMGLVEAVLAVPDAVYGRLAVHWAAANGRGDVVGFL